MNWTHWFSLLALTVCLISFSLHFLRLLKLGKPREHAARAGSPLAGITYSFTTAMNPRNKESAFLHLPTYSAGILFHIASFISIVLYFFILFQKVPAGVTGTLLAIAALVGGLAGLSMLAKRILSKNLRFLSKPDDYISNLLVSLFQFFTALVILYDGFHQLYLVLAGALFLYMPLGKLKHIVYFFAARYHLGLFYGWRGVWPLRKA